MRKMKKMLLVLGLLIVGVAAFARKYEDELVGRMKVAEEKAEAGWETGVRSEMINASLNLDEEWEKELNKVYELILKKLPAKEQAEFKAEQDKWKKDRENQVQKAYDKYAEEEGERMAGELAAGNKLEITKNRTLELAKKYDKLVKQVKNN